MDSPVNRIFSGPITSTFNALRFHDYPLTYQYSQRTKGLKSLKFRTIIGRFQVTLKGLNQHSNGPVSKHDKLTVQSLTMYIVTWCL